MTLVHARAILSIEKISNSLSFHVAHFDTTGQGLFHGCLVILLYLESRILGFRIWETTLRIRNPSSIARESGIRNSWRGIQNPKLSCIPLREANNANCRSYSLWILRKYLGMTKLQLRVKQIYLQGILSKFTNNKNIT